MKSSKIAGLGFYVPEKVVTNQDLTAFVNTTNEWIVERTGVRQRHYFDPEKGETNFGFAVKASEIALQRAGLTPQDIDLIVYATLSPDYYFPGSGVLLQRAMDFRNIAAIDLRAQCSGFIYALSVADQFIKTGMYKHVLVVGSEIHSSGLDYSDHGRHVAVIFGDGAGAVVLSATDEPGKGILSTHLHSEGKYAEELAVIYPKSSAKNRNPIEELQPGGGFYPVMNGQYVFKHAVTRMPEAIMEALEANNYKPEDIDILVPHQANIRITQAVQQRLGLPDEKVVSNIQNYGNTTAASIPIALCEAWEAGRIKEGDLVCLCSFGSGFTWASALIRW
ncbi:3-oxoacyl-ACP synthase III family protein [Rhodoflexus caldus]|uniref:3-oxoacyl-ACP synthase III family protein n=1 Tax=Rhodoflexus caldus TaxID=2891236 RepID=UPI00202A29F3|nr:beta-ketoacyl-ACP synthase III [Rhodoflexus caldus]